MIVPRRPDSLSPFRPVRLTPAGIHRVEVVLTSEPWLQRLPMLTRFAGRPRHQQTLRSPLVLSAEQSTGMPRARSTPAVASSWSSTSTGGKSCPSRSA